nr:uncharacterized protein LOC109420419 isoform X1 [Aedes albopictus]XP_029712953.1 uncharacterized protein LOC109420419 isoform X1 [Aedes albopictus]
MKEAIRVLILSSIVYFLHACDQPIKHYTTIGCIANEQTNLRGCPISYDCLSLTNRSKDKCYLFGNTYNIGEQVPDDETAGTCTALHTCVDGGVNSAYFIYAVQDCFEMIQPPNVNCILQYRPKQCCSFNQICDHDIANLKMCVINGSRYYEGERMRIPNKPCSHCICSDDFDMANVDSNYNCYEEKCLFEIHWNEFLLKGAAPVYTEGRCCPTSWRLPEITDDVVHGPSDVANINIFCEYGNLTLKVGDRVKIQDKAYNCICVIPPMVSCEENRIVG